MSQIAEADKQAHIAKEEADRKAIEEEKARRKKHEEIKNIEESLNNGRFELTPEEEAEHERLTEAAASAEETYKKAEGAYDFSTEVQEVNRLKEQLSSKKIQLTELGFLKGRERKELQAEILDIENSLALAEARVTDLQAKNEGLKKDAEAAREKLTEYYLKVTQQKKEKLETQLKRNKICLARVGDYISFGQYKQKKQGKEKENIEWRVLAKEDNRMLLISDKALDSVPYNWNWNDVTWETCTLRKWLNNDFYKAAFTAEEQALIQSTKVTADKIPDYGNATTDKVFLLSKTEAEKYFTSDEDRMCVPTEYAVNNGAYTSSDYSAGGKATCGWWLRSLGYIGCHGNDFATYVGSDGSVNSGGDVVDDDGYCVRPALWINPGKESPEGENND